MEGQANLIAREDKDQLQGSDYPLIGLINLTRLDHRKLVATSNTVELRNKLQDAVNHLTQRIVKYWSQNRHIQICFDVRDAKAGNPEGMRQGVNVWGEVCDSVYWATTPLSNRSRVRLVLLIPCMVRGRETPRKECHFAAGRAWAVAARSTTGEHLSLKEQRWALNQPVQSTASLIFKEALNGIINEFGVEPVILPVHDAVLL